MLDTPTSADIASHQGRTIFDGQAWVGGQWQHTQCSELPGEYRIRVGTGPTYSIGPDGAIACLGPQEDFEKGALEGPVGIVSAALGGVFCLHSSANLLPQGGVAFLGASGRGKSTLASLLSANGRPRLADDMLKLRLEGNKVFTDEPRHCLAAIYLLGAEGGRVESTEVLGIEAFRSVVEHSVGARLFGAELLGAHFDFCATLSSRVPVYRLDYPRRLDIAAAVVAAVTADAAERLSRAG